MTDSFEVLRASDTPVEPDPAFAARLRARLERAVFGLPGGRNDMGRYDMGTITRLRHGDIGYASLCTRDADRAAAFYREVLGWRVSPGTSPQGRRIEDVTPPLGLWGGQERDTLFLCYVVDDVAAAVDRVRAAGGTAGEPRQEPYGFIADCEDDQGLPFAVFEAEGETHAGGGTRRGELTYVTICFPDVEAAKRFYGSVLGWRFVPGGVEHGWGVRIGDTEVRPMTGFWGGKERAGVVPMYAVDDIDRAVAKVRELGGSSTEPERQPYGMMADCRDDQGSAFHLGQLNA